MPGVIPDKTRLEKHILHSGSCTYIAHNYMTISRGKFTDFNFVYIDTIRQVLMYKPELNFKC